LAVGLFVIILIAELECSVIGVFVVAVLRRTIAVAGAPVACAIIDAVLISVLPRAFAP